MDRSNPIKEELTTDEINEMEERRISMMNDAGIDERKVLHDAGERIQIWNGYFNENMVRGKDDMNFVLRDQWTAVERSEFTRLFKPAMTYNKLYDATKKVSGEQRKDKPDLIVRSLTGKANQKQIDLRADLVRTISYQSQNDLVYQSAFNSALMMGYGAFQVMLDYESPRSFNQIIKYEIIPDPNLCSWDPTALKPHKGDGNFCSRRYIMGRDEFFSTYPYITNPVSYVDDNQLLDFQWMTRETITICDEFVKEWYPLIIYKLSNGMTVDQYEWEEAQESHHKQKEITEGSIVSKIIEKGMPRVINERQTQDYKIMHYRIIQNQIIDFNEWPSRQLPIPFVDGDSHFIDGKQYTKSFIHEARDAQKFINYVGSEIAAEIKNRRREQWLGTADNIVGNELMWRNPEQQLGILIAKPDIKTGMMPQKMPAWDLSPALIQNFQRGSQDIKEILGISESEALQGRDISGKARRERRMEGSMSAYVFRHNLNQAVEQGGRIVMDLLPYIIGQDERHMVVSKKDGKTESIVLNKMNKEGKIENQIEAGEYDIEIDSGPSFAVQKEIALEFLQQTLAANPQSFPLVADLWAKNLDVQFMPQIAERFKTMVPPEILAKEEGKPPPPPQPNPQMMMMQQEMKMQEQEMKIKEQKIQLDHSALMERAEELKIRQEKHEIEKAEMIMKAHMMTEKMGLDNKKLDHDIAKSDMDFSAKISKVLSDLHK